MREKLIEYRVVGYIRESTRGQTVRGYRAGFQKDEIERYCKRNSFKLVKMFEDSGSGKNLKRRPNFQHMISFAKENVISFIIVEDITRFYREFKDGLEVEDKLLKENGIIVIDPEDYNPRDYKNSGISPQAWRQRAHRRVDAEGERRDIIERVTDGISEKKASRQYVGPLAYALEWVDPAFPKYIRYKEQEGKIVQEIFRLCLSGMGCGAIAKHLNDKGYKIEETVTKELIRKNGKPYFKKEVNYREFTFDLVRHILTNKTYIGRQNTGQPLRLLTLDTKEEEVNIEPLIHEDVFNRVPDQLQKHRRGKKPRNKNSRQTDRVYLFQGIIKHADCGCQMHGVPEKLRNGEITRRYQCSGAKNGTCKARLKSFRAEEVEKQIIELLKEIKLENGQKIESNLRDIIKLSAAEMSKPRTLENLTLAQKDELRILNAALSNGYEWMLKDRKEEAERRLTELKQIAASKTEEMLKYYDFQELRRILTDLALSFSTMQSLAAKQELLAILFQELFVGKQLPEKPHKHAAGFHWMAGSVKDYELKKDAAQLKVLLRQFIPVLFEEIQISESADEIPIKKVVFKPTGLFLLMTDGVKSTKKKS